MGNSGIRVCIVNNNNNVHRIFMVQIVLCNVTRRIPVLKVISPVIPTVLGHVYPVGVHSILV